MEMLKHSLQYHQPDAAEGKHKQHKSMMHQLDLIAESGKHVRLCLALVARLAHRGKTNRFAVIQTKRLVGRYV